MAKKAPMPDPLYVYCTKTLFALESHGHVLASPVSHTSPGKDREKLPTLPPGTFYPISSERHLPSPPLRHCPLLIHECVSIVPRSLPYADLWLLSSTKGDPPALPGRQ
jgi:hypothetical protein